MLKTSYSWFKNAFVLFSLVLLHLSSYIARIVCVVSSVDNISNCQLEGPGFDSRIGHMGLNI